MGTVDARVIETGSHTTIQMVHSLAHHVRCHCIRGQLLVMYHPILAYRCTWCVKRSTEYDVDARHHPEIESGRVCL
eukprot:scaffold3201_cov1650-Pavlova_lutheri.AAC.1